MASATDTPSLSMRVARHPALTLREKLDLLTQIKIQLLEEADYRLGEAAPCSLESVDAAVQQMRRDSAAAFPGRTFPGKTWSAQQ